MKKLIWPWGIGLFILFFTVTAPSSAADVVHNTVGVLGGVANGLSDFVSEATAGAAADPVGRPRGQADRPEWANGVPWPTASSPRPCQSSPKCRTRPRPSVPPWPR